MSKLSGTEATSYVGAGTSIFASLTLTDIGVIVGIFTALLTFALNAIYTYRKDRREQLESEAAIEKMRGEP